MFCKKAILINWGNIPHLEFDFGPINLFSGGNGSGKTTAADAIQSLMTAAHENLFNYNPGQDETTQRGRGGKQVRTLASYVLGCDDGSYARVRSCDGYVAAQFHPTEGETGEAFSAVMMVRASLDKAGNRRQARQDDIQFLIINNESVRMDHFVKEDTGGKYVVPLPQVAGILKQEFGAQAVEQYDKKSAYLRRLYGALRGQSTAVSDREAKHAARTFSNFMAYKPVKSINDFVAREVLEPKDLSEDIRQVSELMKTIHGMEQETRLLNESIETLTQADKQADSFIEGWQQLRQGEYTEISRRLFNKQNEYVQAKAQQLENTESITETEHRIEAGEKKKTLLLQQITDLKAKRQGIPALKDKDKLNQDRDQAQLELTKKAPELLKQSHQFGQNLNRAEQLSQLIKQSSLSQEVPGLISRGLNKAITRVIEAGDDAGIDAQKLMTIDWLGSGDLESKLDSLIAKDSYHHQLFMALHDSEVGEQSIRDQLFSVRARRLEQQKKYQQQTEARQLEVQRLQNHSISYPPHVQQALREIHEQCPAAKPSVLCDYIEVLDPNWQMAIEGYIGGARFSIIVEEDFEAEAIAIVRGIKGRRNNARVIQGSKVMRDGARISVPKNSILDLMEFDHKTAEYYIKASYGNVLRVQDEYELRKTARGITPAGLGSGNYSMFRCDVDDSELVFGQTARVRALAAKEKQLEQQQQQAQQLISEHRSLRDCLEWIDGIASVRSAETVKDLLELYHVLQNTEQQLEGIDLSEFKDLDDSLLELESEYQNTEKQLNLLHHEKGEFSQKTKVLAGSIDKLANEQEQIQEQQEIGEVALLKISEHNNDFDAESSLKQAEEKARDLKQDTNFFEQNRQLGLQLDSREKNLYEHILQHNQHCNTNSAIVYNTVVDDKNSFEFYQAIINIKKDIGLVFNSLKNNVLVGKHEKLVGLRDSFNTAFVTNLCHSIYQSITDGKRILEELNGELEHHRFGDDQERFYFGFQWIPEFQEYHKFFKELIDNPNLGDGSTLFDAELSKKSCLVRDKLMEMLLDKDEQTALRELKRISDYRNYRQYEIYKEPLNKEPIALSTYGTGSGGQLETPAYIIRSAAVTSAFRFNEGDTHCRMVLVDEAFSKMDETRSRQVISYLTETLGLQLMFIMPTSKSGPFMDLISNQVIFSKCPSTEKVGELSTRVLVDRKTCNQEKIKQLWANHRKVVRNQGMLDFMEEFV